MWNNVNARWRLRGGSDQTPHPHTLIGIRICIGLRATSWSRSCYTGGRTSVQETQTTGRTAFLDDSPVYFLLSVSVFL